MQSVKAYSGQILRLVCKLKCETDLIMNTLLEYKELICEKLMPREEKIFFSLRLLSERAGQFINK